MKQWFFIPFILLFSFLVWSTTMMNKDNPAKGFWEFKPIKLWEKDGAKTEIFSGGTIARGWNGKVYYLDHKQSKVYIYSPGGKFLGSFGRRGEGPGEFKMIWSIHTLHDKVIVPITGKYMVFSQKGKLIKEHKLLKQMKPYCFINEDKIGFMDKDADSNDIFKTYDFKTRKETIIDTFQSAMDIDALEKKMEVVLIVNRVHTFFRDGLLYYGTDNQFIIKKADTSGKILLTFGIRGRQKTRITEDMKMKTVENFKINGASPSKHTLKQMTRSIPDEAPYYNRLVVDTNGFIYIFRSGWENTSGTKKIDIFSPQGVYLYTSILKLPEGLIIKWGPAFYRDTMVVFVEDNEGEGMLAMFKISLPSIGADH